MELEGRINLTVNLYFVNLAGVHFEGRQKLENLFDKSGTNWGLLRQLKTYPAQKRWVIPPTFPLSPKKPLRNQLLQKEGNFTWLWTSFKNLHNSLRWEMFNYSSAVYSLVIVSVPHPAEILLIYSYLHWMKFRPIIWCQSNCKKSLSSKQMGLYLLHLWRHLPTFDPM